MLKSGLHHFKDKNVLLLQGPIGPFFYRLSKDLKAAGATVFKINFNGGDLLFYPAGAVSYTKSLALLEEFLENFCTEHNIDTMLFFNDCRPLHRVAMHTAQKLSIKTGVFEEGYIRPNFITFENGGVNAFSPTPRDPKFYKNLDIESDATFKNINNSFPFMATWAILYWAGAFVLGWYFNNKLYHRSLNPLEFYPWLVSLYRKFRFKSYDKKNAEKILAKPKEYFIVPLQVHNDTQIATHFKSGSVEQFIEKTIISFAKHSDIDKLLVFKHHPMDRGYKNYTNLIESIAISNDVHKRVFYLHELHLPTFLDNALGCIVINSTVGLSAIHHGCPLKVCGSAFYNIEGLVFQGTLDEFWKGAKEFEVDTELYLKLQSYIIKNTQLNGNYYKKIPSAKSFSGVIFSQHPFKER